MPYLTPEEIPEDGICRPLTIPASTDWLAIVSGALTELTKPYNWEQFGAVTVDEAVERMQQLVDEYYAGDCVGCLIDDVPLFRVNGEGIVEQWDGSGWISPAGDYAYPAIPAREEATPTENICLAAANAVNALFLVYEDVTDQYNEIVDPELGIATFGLSVGTTFAFAIGASILGSILLFIALPFAIFYYLLETFGSDLWDAEFTKKLICVFTVNATDTAGVVTFNMQGILNTLQNITDLFDLTETELKLFLQVGFMLHAIGEQGLNQAGTTTAITTPDCDTCGDHCYVWDFEESPGDWELVIPPDRGHYESGVGWVCDYSDEGGSTNVAVYIRLPVITGGLISKLCITYDCVPSTNANILAFSGGFTPISSLPGNADGLVADWEGSGSCGDLDIQLAASSGVGNAGGGIIKKVRIHYPQDSTFDFGLPDNCLPEENC